MGWVLALAPLLPTLITAAERLFGKKTGPTKLDTVMKAALAFLTNLATAGKLGGPAPNAAELIAEINKQAAILFPPGTTVSDSDAVAGPDPSLGIDATKDSIKKLIIWALS